jgi:hypothetical protein
VRKVYKKPTVEIDNFMMDVDILAGMSKSELEAARFNYEFNFGGDIADEAAFDEFLRAYYGYDNSTSGYCYFTLNDAS